MSKSINCCFYCGQPLSALDLGLVNAPAKTSLSCAPCPDCMNKLALADRIFLVEGRQLSRENKIRNAIKAGASKVVVANLLAAKLEFFDEPTGRFLSLRLTELKELTPEQRQTTTVHRYAFAAPEAFDAIYRKFKLASRFAPPPLG